MDLVNSVHDIPIRITDERWLHIVEEHSELSGRYYEVLETIGNPDAVYEGSQSECLAVKKIAEAKFLVAIYKIMAPNDGFLITAFLTKREKWFGKRRRIWPTSS